MPETSVIGQSPLSFNAAGSHLMLPLVALYFDSSGKLKADRWPLYAENAEAVDLLLARMLREGVLRRGPQPARMPAFTATALTPGSNVTVGIEISNVEPDTDIPENSKADFTVGEEDRYIRLEPSSLAETIGDAPNKGKRPGLVFLSSSGAPGLPKQGTYAMAGDPATVDVPANSGGGTAFSLTSRGSGADAALTSVDVIEVDATANTFSMNVRWTKSSADVAIKDLGAEFDYVMTVTAPDGGFRAPVEGKSSLSGGADAISVDAVKPSVTVLAQ